MDEHSKEGTRGQFPLCPVLQEWTVSLATYAENFRQSALVLATSHFNNIARFVCPTFTTVRAPPFLVFPFPPFSPTFLLLLHGQKRFSSRR